MTSRDKKICKRARIGKYEKRLRLEDVLDLLDYDPLTGIFTWRVSYRSRKAGSVAGFKLTHGYIGINIRGERYRAHRLAWLIHTGAWPTSEIDHIDGDPANNAIVNLREATRTENSRNRGQTGYHLRPHNKTNPYYAKICVNGKNIHIGYFPTPELARAAYEAASLKYFGKFSTAYSRDHASVAGALA
jgi:hypothetical protein